MTAIEGVRGRGGIKVLLLMKLLAPIIVAGEESPDEAAHQRTEHRIAIQRRKDLKPASHRQAFYKLCAKADLLGSFGRRPAGYSTQSIGC